MKRILIIEDDETIAAIERDYLTVNDFETDIAASGPDGIRMGRMGRYDLILLDLMLPGMDGFDVCRRLRETLDIPILMVTARQEDIDKIKGLGMGADDYITKPYRSQIQLGSILLQQDSRRVFVDGKEIELKNKEYELLLFLMLNADIVFSKETLYERILGYDAMGDNATVAVHINRLRDKIEKTPSEPRYIQTVWGAGYRFKP